MISSFTTLKALRGSCVHQLDLKMCEEDEWYRQESADKPRRFEQLLTSSTATSAGNQGVLHLRTSSRQRWQRKLFTAAERCSSLFFVVVFCNSITVTLFYCKKMPRLEQLYCASFVYVLNLSLFAQCCFTPFALFALICVMAASPDCACNPAVCFLQGSCVRIRT
jgi:hypothetical protein